MDEVDTNLADTLRVVEELNRCDRGGGRTLALKLCVFVTKLSFVANTLFEASRADSVYVVLYRIGKEVCLFVFPNETHGSTT